MIKERQHVFLKDIYAGAKEQITDACIVHVTCLHNKAAVVTKNAC